MVKKVVSYLPQGSHIRVGYGAIVHPLDHTSELVSNTCPVTTSKVIRHDKNSGEFETENSIYKPQRTINISSGEDCFV